MWLLLWIKKVESEKTWKNSIGVWGWKSQSTYSQPATIITLFGLKR